MRTKAPRNQGQYYYRDQLSLQGQWIYDALEAHCRRKDYRNQIQFRMKRFDTFMKDISRAYQALRDDHPEYFYLGTQYRITIRGLEGTLEYRRIYHPDMIDRITLQLRRRICQLVRGTAYHTLEEQERMVYQRIAKMLTYDNQHGDCDHNVVGPILYRSGVCEGYNAMLLLCFRRLGIPCVKAFGKMSEERATWHCWTKLWLDEQEYHCDVTWDSGISGQVPFQYFNLNEKQIRKDHILAFFDEEGNLCINPSSEIQEGRTGSEYTPVPAICAQPLSTGVF